MQKLTFFTPIVYTDPSKSLGSSLLEKVDSYFYLGGKVAYVIQGQVKDGPEKVILSKSQSSSLARIGKVFSYFTVVIPLLMLIAKAALRSKHAFKLIDPKQKLEKGVQISEEIVKTIQDLMPRILKLEEDDKIEYLKEKNMFKLKGHPKLIFKTDLSSRDDIISCKEKYLDSKKAMEDRFDNMVKGKKIILIYNLGRLIIPPAKKLTFNTDDGQQWVVIAEKVMDITHEENAQKELYLKHSKDLDDTIRQVAVFIAKTGFNDVRPDNIPILNELEGFSGPRRVALINLEHMENSIHGFIGDDNGSCGLIHCVSEAQIDIVIEEANKQGVGITEKQAQDAKKRRLQDLESDKKLRAFYEEKDIKTGKEAIEVNLYSLGLDLKEQGQISDNLGIMNMEGEDLNLEEQTVTLKKVTADVIKEMNGLIQKSSEQASIKSKRQFVLDLDNSPLNLYNTLGLSENRPDVVDEEEKKTLWISRIITALVDKKYIFKVDKLNGHRYFIQA